MENIDGLLRTNICNILNSVLYGTVNGVINAVKAAGVASLSDLQNVQEKDLSLVLEPIQRQQLITAWSKQNVEGDKNRQSIKKENVDPSAAPESSGDVPVFDDFTNSVDCGKIRQSIKKEKVDPPALDSESYGSQKWYTKLDDIINSVDCDEIKQRVKIEKVDLPALSSKSPGDVTKLDDFINSTSLAGTSDNLAPKKRKWNRNKRNGVLLQLYRKYRTELDSCPSSENLTVWRKIADEFQQQCSFNLSDKECRMRILEMKSRYRVNKTIQGRLKSKFMQEARKAFEPLKSDTSGETSDNLAWEKRNWNKYRRKLLLLQVYRKYRTELDSCPSSENLAVWRKIADEFQQQCSFNLSDEECRVKILDMKSRYRINKTSRPNLKNRFMQEAEKIFGPLKSGVDCDDIRQCIKKEKVDPPASASECSGDVTKMDGFRNINFSAAKSSNINLGQKKKLEQQNRSCQKTLLKPSGKSKESYNLLLLQLYGKYKTGVDSPDHEFQSVWKNIATEMRDIFMYDCNDVMCRSDVNELKRRYDYFKLYRQSQSVPYYFDAAQQVFEYREYPANFSAGQSSNIHLEQMSRRYEFTLLQLYGKYKTGVACPDLEELCVWERIATEMRQCFFNNRTHLQCRSDVIQMKYNYDMFKMYPYMMEMPHYFETARQVFEFSINPALHR